MLPLSLEMYDRLVGAGVVRELPTTRLYLLAYARMLPSHRTVRAHYHGANVFTFDDTAFVVRQTGRKGLRRARNQRRVVWIVDDHFAEGSDCDNMPDAYRRRLADLHARFEPEILEIADVVLCSCDALTDHYRARGVAEVHTIHPLHAGADGPTETTEAAGTADDPGEVSVGILQTKSHLADLRSISPQINAVLEANPEVSLIHLLRGCDTGLVPSHQIQAMRPMPWRAYAGWRRRLALGLYPLLDTPFNRYRSLNKFLEYVGRDAVPLVSDTASMAMVPGEFRVAAEDWAERILALTTDAEARRRLLRLARDWIADMRFGETTLATLDTVIA